MRCMLRGQDDPPALGATRKISATPDRVNPSFFKVPPQPPFPDGGDGPRGLTLDEPLIPCKWYSLSKTSIFERDSAGPTLIGQGAPKIRGSGRRSQMPMRKRLFFAARNRLIGPVGDLTAVSMQYTIWSTKESAHLQTLALLNGPPRCPTAIHARGVWKHGKARSGLMSDVSLTIRVSRSAHELLRALADQSNSTITAVVDEAVRDLQRKKFWADFNASCEALQADPAAWADLRREDAAWEETLADGLKEEQQANEHQKRRGKPGAR